MTGGVKQDPEVDPEVMKSETYSFLKQKAAQDRTGHDRTGEDRRAHRRGARQRRAPRTGQETTCTQPHTHPGFARISLDHI